MTQKLYNDNAYIKEFSAQITALIKRPEGNAIVLDETYFYPEGGGQPCDYGRIEQLGITNVIIEDEVIYHLTNGSIDHLHVDQLIDCFIDYDRRFAFMQQHTGQHVLSASAEKLFDANTVGFHIGEDYVTIDLDKKLSAEDIEALEELANSVVFSNVSVIIHYPTPEELAQMPLRKQPKVTENIRVIEVEKFDFSPCGGTHTLTTSEIGLIKIKRVDSYKSGCRLEFVCGIFALENYKKRNDTVNTLMRLFSVQDSEIVNFCEQLLENQKLDRLLLSDLKEQLLRSQVVQLLANYEDELDADIKVISLLEEQMPMADLRQKTAMICEADNYIVIAAANDFDKTHFVLSKSKNLSTEFDMGQLFKTHIAPLGIKGGGNAFVAQGGINTKLNIESTIAPIENALQFIIEN